MSTTSKYMLVAERLSRRIKSGDYHLHGVPAERRLATQVGVSYMTARKAIQQLLDNGLLYRMPNGRLAVRGNDDDGPAKKQVALLAPAWESNEANNWDINLTQLRTKLDFSSRIVHYVHWDDPVIADTIRQFDATLFLAPDSPSSDFTAELVKLGRPLIILNRDWSGFGLQSLRLFPPRMIQKLLDHMASLGHRNIDCFNVQHCGQVMREWIGHWLLWGSKHKIAGELINEPVMPFTETLVAAYNVISHRIRQGNLKSTAMLCLTETAAIGATRALLDHGIRPGHDIALCTTGSVRCEYLNPSLTTLEQPDPKPYLTTCLEWALHPEIHDWQGPLLIEPQDLKVMARESTVPDVAKSRAPQRMQLVATTDGNQVNRSAGPSLQLSNV